MWPQLINLKNRIFSPIVKWWQEGSLNRIIQEEKKSNPEIERLLRRDVKPLWFSWWDVGVVIILFLIFLLLTHAQTLLPYSWFVSIVEFLYPFSGSPFALTSGNHYQNLIAVHAGIGAVLIGLAFFIAQWIVKEENSYKKFIILRRSKFFALLLAEVLFFFLFIWGSVNIFSIIPVFFMGMFTLFSLYQTVNLIVDNFELKKEEQDVFFKKLRHSFLKVVDVEIIKLIGGNQLRDRFKGYEDIIEITPFSPTDKRKYTAIKTETAGVFRNLNLRALKGLLSTFQNIAPPEERATGGGSGTQNTSLQSSIKNPYCYLSPRYLSDTKEVNDVLLWVRNDLFEDEDKKQEIIKQARRAFTIAPSDFDLEHARDDIKKLKNLCLDLIRDQRSDELSESLNLYTQLIEDFYSYLKPYGGGFSEKQARDMSMEIAFGGLKPIAWISEDIQEIFERGVQSDSREIIRAVGYLPVRLMKYSIDYKDHLIFQQFQFYPSWLYRTASEAQKKEKEALADFLLDRSWRYLKEVSDYYLEPKLKEDDYPEEEFRSFACAILKIFQGLLKSSFDNKDHEAFKVYLSTTSGLFRHLDITERFKDHESERVSDFIKHKKEEMLFGIASWILHKFSLNKSDEVTKKFYHFIQNTFRTDIKEFTKVFLRAHDFDIEHFWSWDDWEMREKGEGEVHSIQILEKLEKFYATKSLSLLEGKTDDQVKAIQLPHTRDLAYLAEGTRDLIKILDDIAARPENWRFVLSEDAISKVGPFKALLSSARDQQEEEELEVKRGQVISQKKVEEFKKEVVEQFYETAYLRDLFINYFKTYTDQTATRIAGKENRLGINTVDDKASFFDEWHVHYVGRSESYARAIASGEDSHLLEDISANCTEVPKKEFEKTLTKFENLNDVVILAPNMAFWRFFEDAKSFKSKWHRDAEQIDVRAFGGWYEFQGHSIPVFETYHGKKDREVLVLRRSKIGKLIQRSPLSADDSPDNLSDIFYIDVQAMSENNDLMEKFIQEPPEWLKEVGDEEKQREHLRERVRIQIFERFEFEKNEEFEGYKFQVEE